MDRVRYRVILAALLALSACSSTPRQSPAIADLRTAVILGGSVSSGFSGRPAPEIVAERLGLAVDNRARVCNRVDASESQGIPAGSLVVNIDGNYWRSYDRDCRQAVQSVQDFYRNTAGLALVVATVPERNAGWFYRGVCLAASAEQGCREAINAQIHAGCRGRRCVLLDADAIYALHADESDIHLTPEIWRQVADQHFNAIYEKLRSP